MPDAPGWLPSLIPLDGKWEERVVELYATYQEIFFTGSCRYDGKPVHVGTKKTDPPYEDSFWHLISRDDKHSGDRLPDFDRARRLLWIPAVLNNSNDNHVLAWDFQEAGGTIRRYIWLKEFDFVLILIDKGYVWILITAFFISSNWSRKNFEEKYTKRTV